MFYVQKHLRSLLKYAIARYQQQGGSILKQKKPSKKLSIVGEYQLRTKRLLRPEIREFNYVYILEAISTNRVKIGTSCKPKNRIEAIKTDCPFPLRLLLLLELPWEYELVLHHIFNEYRLHGEWFELCDPILEFINECLKRSDDDTCDYLNTEYNETMNGDIQSLRSGDNPKGEYVMLTKFEFTQKGRAHRKRNG